MKKVNDIINKKPTFDGIPPEFTKVELRKLKALSETTTYLFKAYNFVHAYNRGAEPWKWMNKRQRKWLWKIKDDIAYVVRRDMQKSHDNPGAAER